MNSYILICTDTEDGDDAVIPAVTVLNARLAASRWPLYERTRYRRNIVVGDRLVLYAGGGRAGGKCFHAIAVVGQKIAPDRSMIRRFSGLEGHLPAVDWLHLAKIERLDPCIPMAEILAKLSFIPANRSRWGVAMMGGVRKISDIDWDHIVGFRASGRCTRESS
jgi:hypothetical protein